MAKKPPYIQIINLNIFEDPVWGAYARGETDLPQQRYAVSGNVSNWFFYLNDFKRAREVSYAYSVYAEQNAANRDEYDALYHLFQAALYRSLAQKFVEAQELWQTLIERRRQLQEEEMLRRRLANYWVNEAYALTKLERYSEVAEPAQRGFDAIRQGKGIQSAPHKNSREYGLVDVLVTLAAYKLNPSATGQQETQKSLITYKKENVRYGRHGYGVIFDLQFAYSDIFTPVLPGADPEKD